jgi:hypothetical protein
MYKLIGIALISLTFLMPYHLPAAESDTSSPLLCSVINAAEYTLDEGCLEGTADSFDLPQFIKIDLKNQTINEVGENTKKRTSKIINLKRIDSKIIMQGIENGRSWSVIIDEKTGKMSAAASDEGIGFVVLGYCLID